MQIVHQNFFQYFDFSQMFFFFNCTWISKQYSVLSEHKLSCIHEKVCNTLSLSAYTCSTADGSLILIISITQMICLFWPKIGKWILPIQWLSFSITFFWDFICCVSLLWELGQNHAFWMCNQKQANMSTLLFFLHFIIPYVHVHL